LLFSAARVAVLELRESHFSFAKPHFARRQSACWRAPSDNQWITTPLEAAYDHVPRLPRAPAETPGQFSFASQGRVEYILKTAGLTRIRLERCDISLDLAGEQGVDVAIETAMGFGPVRRAIEGQSGEKIWRSQIDAKGIGWFRQRNFGPASSVPLDSNSARPLARRREAREINKDRYLSI
jgi:hypothetical protein